MKAEALNEFEGPSQAVWDAINKVRKRAGIPNVETSYTSAFAKTQGKHTTQTGMREIIAQERKVEFALEGSIFWDMIRTRKATEEFSTPAMGWNFGAGGADFFQRQILQPRVFTLKDCLWPIDDNELDKNSRLIQNPGW
ncbi:hypothetical protein AGMMS50239_36550 [Bacteroidia bacterium]|nr:hypothetical protein AGMMS50239_36550 [Bacteroidia bacterium]